MIIAATAENDSYLHSSAPIGGFVIGDVPKAVHAWFKSPSMLQTSTLRLVAMRYYESGVWADINP